MPSSTFLQPRLDAPDHNVRMIQLKRTQGQPLNRRDLSRLATRMSVEESTLEMPQGGQVKGMLPREQDPASAYQRGYEGTRRLFQQPGGGAPAPRTGLTPAGPAPSRATKPGSANIGGKSFPGTASTAPSAMIGGKSYPAAGPTTPSASIGGKDYPVTAESDNDADDTTAPAPTAEIGAPPVPAGNDAIVAPPAPQPLQQSALPATPTTSAAPQTESNNPLSGDTNRAPSGDVTSINPAGAAGFSRRGAAVPAGNDHVGGTGIFARRFSSPGAKNIYESYVKRLFGEPEIA